MNETDDRTSGTRTGVGRRFGVAAGLIGVGVAAGAVLVMSLSANAATGTAAPSPSVSAPASGGPEGGGQGAPGGTRDESKSQRPDEHLLTGDTATKVTAAALAKYPGATIQRVETDSDGVYEAHLTTADGNRVTVEVGKDFAVTGEEQQHR
ncbi:MAG TPA: hypothetical protein VMU51_24480 [Mycobacteriales bacterium]|nr:hypothetical protein [Mycobacteriales bacterium]